MTHYICKTCGTQFAATDQPPEGCPICQDERQYIGPNGQQCYRLTPPASCTNTWPFGT